MLLADPADIRSDLGFDNMTDINDAIQAALLASEPLIGARLGTGFDLVTDQVDVFYVPSPPFQQGQAVSTEFRLKRGFLESYSAIYGATFDALTSDPLDLAGILVGSADQLEKGVLVDYRTVYVNSYVQFTYTAGFHPASADPGEISYDLTEVPQWLQELAKIRAKIALADSAVVTEAQIKIDTKTLTSQYNTIAGYHQRYAPVALLPVG